MTGDGVEATGGRDEFTGHLHADEHFATGFVVVAGGGENGFDVLWAGTVVQELEDGLAVQGADGTGTEAFEGGAVAFREPMKDGGASFGDVDLVGEDARGGAEGVFGGQQKVMACVGGVGGEQQATAGGFE